MAEETAVWIDADGISWNLSVEWDVSKRFMPPIKWDDIEVPEQPGGHIYSVRHGVKEFVLPIWIEEATETALRTAMRNLVAAMDPIRGNGTIRMVAADGVTRDIVCRYSAGLEVEEKLGDTSGLTAQKVPIMFKAYEPYWTDTFDTTLFYPGGSTVALFFPFFPLALSGSETFGSDTVTNTGDVEAWPVWTIAGPCTSITATNSSTGLQWTLSSTIVLGESITVDTRPGAKTVIRNDGSSLFQDLTPASSLWPFRRGTNSIVLSIGGTTANSSVTCRYKKRYLSP